MATKEKLTRSGAIRRCRNMWRKLAKTGDDCKPAVSYHNRCPLCDYVCNTLCFSGVGFSWAHRECVEHCPLEWPRNKYGNRVCFGTDGLYIRWRACRSITERKRLASQIAELPVRRIKK